MADLSITAANVEKAAGAVTESYIAGATVTAGQAVYIDSATGKAALAACDLTAEAANVKGIALHGASADQPLEIQVDGTIYLGAGTEGAVYVLSDTPGGFASHTDADDPASTEYTALIGVGNDDSGIDLCIFPTTYQTA